jgi:hypothetical protein
VGRKGTELRKHKEKALNSEKAFKESFRELIMSEKNLETNG